MISDVLHEAIAEMRRYLDDPVMGKCYQGEIRACIEGLVKEMGQAREVLDLFDTPPAAFEVVIRGPQGCGKSTAAEVLAESMASRYQSATTKDAERHTIVLDDGEKRIVYEAPAWRRPYQQRPAPAPVLTIRVEQA